MFRRLENWIWKVANGPYPEGYDRPVDVKDNWKPEPPRSRGLQDMTAQDIVGQMSQSMGTIYRIDNGFIMYINMNDERHLGSRGSLVYGKDAQELAEKLVAHEAAIKMGVGRGDRQGNGGIPTPAEYAALKQAPPPGIHPNRI